MEAGLNREAIPAPIERTFSQGWLRAPSLSDLFYLFFTVWMFLASPVGWQRLLLDADAAFHTRIGQLILETGVPHVDPFSYTKPGQTWYAFEWLSEVLFGLVFNAASFKGLVLLAATIITLYTTILLKYTLWRGANGLIALLVTLVGASATSIHYYARPHLFTLLLLVTALWLCDNHRRNSGRLIWTLVPMAALWVNLHGGYAMFFALLALRIGACFGEGYFWSDLKAARNREARDLLLVMGACLAASFANPYGWGMHKHVIEFLTNPWPVKNVGEFLSPDFRTEELFHFMVLLFAGLVCVVPLVRKRQLVEALTVVFLAYASLVSVRHLTIFVLAVGPVIACEASEWWKSLTSGQAKSSLLGLLGEISENISGRMPGTSPFIPVVIVALMVWPGIPWPTQFTEGTMPISLVEGQRDFLSQARVFGPDQVGDYLVFRNFPKQRVFFDSRHVYYGAAMADEYLTLLEGGNGWDGVIAKYDVNALLIHKGGALASLARQSADWHSRAVDGDFELFEKR